jgi:pyridoxal phosphate enzyme (YggS family)
VIDPAEVASRVAEVREKIRSAGGHDVSLIAVTKTFPLVAITAARDAGCDGVGENYAQELAEKASLGLPDIDVHFIGALQSNKVKMIAPFVTLWQTIDRESVIRELARRVPGAQILLQVNTTHESTKGGVEPGEVEGLLLLARDQGLDVRGLMTIGPTGGSVSEQESAFRTLRRLVDTYELPVCSMGMSDDFEVAVACGSTMVRIGSRLFGARGGA